MTKTFRNGTNGTELTPVLYQEERWGRPTFVSPMWIARDTSQVPPLVPVHIHPGIELFSLRSGSVRLYLNGIYYQLQPYDCYFISAMIPHKIFVDSKSDYVYCHISDDLLASLPPPEISLELIRIFYLPLKKASPVLLNNREIWNGLKKSCEVFRSTDPFGKMVAWSEAIKVIAVIARNVLPYIELNNKPDETLQRKILTAVEYIANNYTKPFDINTIARICALSRSHLFSSFKQIMQCTPHDYFNKIRINHCFKELVYSNKKMESIAFDCGFDSPRTFYRLFKKVIGQAPHTFRKH